MNIIQIDVLIVILIWVIIIHDNYVEKFFVGTQYNNLQYSLFEFNSI